MIKHNVVELKDRDTGLDPLTELLSDKGSDKGRTYATI